MVQTEDKIREKEKAILLRKNGLSYREILEKIHVAKSTLSLWLRSVDLSKPQIQRLTQKRIDAVRRGGVVKREQRIERTKKIKDAARLDIKNITKREMWLMGLMLYWAEGSKEKSHHPGSALIFSNSDPKMIKLYLRWIFDILQINRRAIVIEIFIHENSKNNLTEVKKYWSGITKLPASYFENVYFKKHNYKTTRRNIGDKYYGLLRVRVRKSSDLVRKVAGWVDGICEYYWGIV